MDGSHKTVVKHVYLQRWLGLDRVIVNITQELNLNVTGKNVSSEHGDHN